MPGIRLSELERELLTAWRARGHDEAPSTGRPVRSDLDAVEQRLLDTWRRYGEPSSAGPLWAARLRHRLTGDERSRAAVNEPPGPPGHGTGSSDRLTGMLHGGAVGESTARGGIRTGGHTAAVLFVLEGLIRAHTRLRSGEEGDPCEAALSGLQRWLHAHGLPWRSCVPTDAHPSEGPDGWLSGRIPPHTVSGGDPAVLAAVARIAAGEAPGTIRQPANTTDSAGAVPLGAAAALWSDRGEDAFRLGTELAALTHGDPDGCDPAGFLAAAVLALLRGDGLVSGLRSALATWESAAAHGAPETVREAIRLGLHRPAGLLPSRANIEATTRGTTGTGALAVAVRAVLASPHDFDTAVAIAADHGGDAVVSAVLCGQLLGALHGPSALGSRAPEAAASRHIVEVLAADATTEFGPHPDTSGTWFERYPLRYARTERTETRHDIGTRGGARSAARQRFVRCVLGCVVGEALGVPVAEAGWDEIRAWHGERGVDGYVPVGHPAGRLGSDGQILLFTLEGVIRAGNSRRHGGTGDPTHHVQHAYQRWLHTQHLSWPRAAGEFLARAPEPDGWLIGRRELFETRAPGRTMMRTLIAFAKGQQAVGTPENPVSDSRSSSAVPRAVAAVLWSGDRSEVFRTALRSAALTHGSPAAYLSAGALAVVLAELVHEQDLSTATESALRELSRHEGHEDVTARITSAVRLAGSGPADPMGIERELGSGWTAPEALAIGLHAALTAGGDFDLGLRTAVNHSGNSATSAAVCGSLLGAGANEHGIADGWLAELELREVVERLAHDAGREFGPHPPDEQEWHTRYPPT